MKKTIFLLVLFLSNFFSSAQLFKEDRLGVSLKVKEGILLAHRPVMVHLLQGQIHCIEASILWKANNRSGWKTDFSRPTYGFSLNYSNLGNPKVLGNYFSSFGFMELPFVRFNRWSIDGKIALGAVYVTKIYNKQTNPKNNVIGSHINAFVQLGVTAKREFNNSNIHFGFDFSHMSNGAYVIPNLGLNLPYFGIGYTQYLREETLLIDPARMISIAPIKRWNISAIAVASFKEIEPLGGKRYNIYSVSAVFDKRFNKKSGLNLTADFIVNSSLRDYETSITGSITEILQIGTFAGYTLNIGDLQALVGMGIYVKNNVNPAGLFYHRLGLRYFFKNNIIASFMVKSHWGRADYLEYGIGYRFK